MNARTTMMTNRTLLIAGFVVLASCFGCQREGGSIDQDITAYRDRMLAQHAEERAGESPARDRRSGPALIHPVAAQAHLPPRAVLLAQTVPTTQPAPEDVLTEMPDPSEARAVFARRLAKLDEEYRLREDKRVVANYRKVVAKAEEYLAMLERPERHPMRLSECIHRALDHNYSIRIESYNPAISAAQIVEAEAAFDVEFFLDTAWADRDQATLSAFQAGMSDTRSISGGFRKLLPTGMTTSVGLSMSRNQNNFPAEIQAVNPAYSSSFVAQFRQPLLRGFGLDVNRARIHIRQFERDISYETFVQKVRDTLLEVERTYWDLAQVRRQAAILAETVAQNRITYENMQERLEHDATIVEVENARSRWNQAHVNYLETIKLVRNAEDRLKNVLNDPALKLSETIEIVPTEVPFIAPLTVDQFAAVRTAVEQRSEIRAAEHRIGAARVNTHATKNAILPQLDLTFEYEVGGMGSSGDNAFDQLTMNRFNSYTVGASFAHSFGERQARAAHRQARLRESQAVVALTQVVDAVVEQVNAAVRTLLVRYEQIQPQLAAVQSAEANLRALQARTQRIDPNYLQTELSAVENLANTRRTLLSVIIGYNTGLVELETAKGTLLEYNNVSITDAPRR